MKRFVYIFFYFIIIRILYIVISGYDTCQLCSDCFGLNFFSDRVLNGNFDMGPGRFILAPFYQFFIAFHKIVFGQYWDLALVASQLSMSALSGIYFYKLGRLLFNEKVAIISTLIFGVFPMTLWWVHTFCTESIFQSTLIISIYFLIKSVKTGYLSDLIISACLFSIVFLTKSHVLLFSPFIAAYYFINFKSNKRFYYPVAYAAICLLFTLPYGLYNLKIHDTYVLSSNGNKYLFYTGNSEYGYISIVEVPEMGTERYEEMSKMNYPYFNGDIHNKIMQLPQNQKQDEYLQIALTWIKSNPVKFLKMKFYNLFFFIMPGVSYRHYSLPIWIFSIIVSLPIYVLGYLSMYKRLKENFNLHFFSLGLFFSMMLFSVIWYVQNRFRTITIEPIYILYASVIIANYYDKLVPYIKQKLFKHPS